MDTSKPTNTVNFKEIEKAVREALPSDHPLDEPDFDPIEFINKRFPNEQSLSKVDACISELTAEVKEIDTQIVDAVREQAATYVKAKRDLQQVKSAIEELFDRILKMKQRAGDSETLVEEICRDVRTLDNAKRNLTMTITALKRLVMLVTALDQLRGFAAERQYKEAANLVLAINQLCLHFSDISHVPKISELLAQKIAIYGELEKQILEDFDAIFEQDQDVIPNLHDACLTVDALNPDLRREIVTKFCLTILEPYKTIFQPPQEASALETTDRRYTWFKREVREQEDHWRELFPSSWKVMRNLAVHFCHFTRQHIVEVLGMCHHVTPPMLMVNVLQKSIEFEEFLASKYEKDNEMDTVLSELELSETHPQRLQQATRNLQYPDAISSPVENRNQHSLEEDPPPRFRGIISECFEAYLGNWVQHEEQQLMELITKVTSASADTTLGEPDEGGPIYSSGRDDEDEDEVDVPRLVYSSASEIFTAFKMCLKRAMAISTHQTLFEIFQVFRRTVRRYTDVLVSRLPRKGLVLSEEQLKCACTIMGTSEFCDSTLPDLSAAILKPIDPAFSKDVNFDSELDALWNLKSKGITVLVSNLEVRIERPLLQMLTSDWTQLQEVSDQSSFVTDIIYILQQQLPVISSHLSVPYYRFFCDKFVQWFIPKWISSIFACNKIGEMGAQQLLLDTYSLKAGLLEIPVISSRGRPVTPGYAKFVLREMGRAEVLLKGLASSLDDSESLKALLEENGAVCSPEDLSRFLSLRALPPASSNLPAHRPPLEDRRPMPPESGSSSPGPSTASPPLDADDRREKFGLMDWNALGENFRQQGLKATEDVRKLFGLKKETDRQ